MVVQANHPLAGRLVAGGLVASAWLGIGACQPDPGVPGVSKADAAPAAATGSQQAPCATLERQLCAKLGGDSEECRLANEELPSHSAARCAALLSRFDQVAAAATRYVEARQALVSPVQRTGGLAAPSVGSPDAPVTLVFFGDFTSPECARGALIASSVRSLHAANVRLVFRHFPLSGNPEARLAAEASLAAHAQGKFWPYYEILFGNPQAHDRAALTRYAQTAGLDRELFDAALDDHRHATEVDADRKLGLELGLTALPALFVNGRRRSFPFGEPELVRLLAEAR